MKTSKPENFRKWLDALRSGEYEQTQYRLRDHSKFCCLGVACDIAKGELGLEWHVDAALSTYTLDDSRDTIPDSVAQWLGIVGDNPMVTTDDDSRELATELNDNDNMTFNEIAELLEREYL